MNDVRRSTTDTLLDLSDQRVQDMARRNHQPEESWTDDTPARLVRVYCKACRQDWPCQTRQALRQICTCPDIDVWGLPDDPATIKGHSVLCPVHGSRPWQ